MLLSISPTANALKTAEELALESRAVRALSEYRLVKDGVSTYQDMGYRLLDGTVPAVKQYEYLAVDAEMAEALTEKRKRDYGKHTRRLRNRK